MRRCYRLYAQVAQEVVGGRYPQTQTQAHGAHRENTKTAVGELASAGCYAGVLNWHIAHSHSIIKQKKGNICSKKISVKQQQLV